MSSELDRVGAILELALYGNCNANKPRDPLKMANLAYERLRASDAIIEKLLAVSAEATKAARMADK